VWHFYWQVKRDVREPLVYAGTLAVLLLYRVARARAMTRARALPAGASVLTSRSGSATAPERT